MAKPKHKFKEEKKGVLNGLEASLRFLRSVKPDERGELARLFDVTITDLEKVVACFRVYMMENER